MMTSYQTFPFHRRTMRRATVTTSQQHPVTVATGWLPCGNG